MQYFIKYILLIIIICILACLCGSLFNFIWSYDFGWKISALTSFNFQIKSFAFWAILMLPQLLTLLKWKIKFLYKTAIVFMAYFCIGSLLAIMGTIYGTNDVVYYIYGPALFTTIIATIFFVIFTVLNKQAS
ncbi:MAG TPA: hypothetical protein VFL76_07495 [Edaphocola sp.]|nr:hypothetical protein [Edaphocola sp.]